MEFNNLKRSSRIIIAFLIGAVSAMALLKIFEVLQIDDEINDKSNTPFSYHSAVSKASPAVVNIFSEQLVNKRINRPRRNIDSIFSKQRNQIKTSLGSGVLFSSDGYILTNQHVIGDQNIKVIVELSDGRLSLIHI